MAARGINYNRSVNVPLETESVIQTLVGGLSGASAYSVTTAGANTLILTRRYTPTWAVVVGVLGIALFLIGALAFLIKETETLTITVSGTGGGARVTASGVGSNEMAARLNSLLASLESGSDLGEQFKVAFEGERFLLGGGPGIYAIWDKNSPDAPVHQFPKTQQGWSLAYMKFQQIQPQSRQVVGPLSSFTGSAHIGVEAGHRDARALPANGLESDTKTCPECAETIKTAARVCRYCGHRFVARAAPRKAATAKKQVQRASSRKAPSKKPSGK